MSRPFTRTSHLAALESLHFDILVVGGGATGLGIAVDSAQRGYRTALVEAHDFAKGTSSRSTKLVHGGVRYLEQMQFALVSEALEERATICANAPHLAHDLAFVVPRYRWWEGPFYGAGLKLYDALAGSRNLGKSRVLSREETMRAIPGVREDGLLGGVEYHDAQFDDARMALALARTAAARGAVVATRAECTGLLKEEGAIVGAEVRDTLSGRALRVRSSTVINATGVWADTLRTIDDPAATPSLEPSRGVHIVLPREFLPADHAIMVPHTDDGRVLFVIPWHGRTLVGTTDTEVERAEHEPRASGEDIGFILRNAGRYLARVPGERDILSVFAGLRPLARPSDEKSSKKVSREHSIVVAPSGLITVTGGKWTTYRRMAEETVDAAMEAIGLEPRACETATLRLHGHDDGGGVEADLPVTRRMYGSDRLELERIERIDRLLGVPMHPSLQVTPSEVIFAARSEMALSVEDVLARRTRSLLLDARAAAEIADEVARLMAQELDWSADEARVSAEAFKDLARGYLPPSVG
ncbi:MAG: glycerol-3-phosphate dehydrogenase/oxidase [Planctomycetaceae bacterium]|nr:glycerol-3-phosphate dehydrogenase/oxidase [Planctomycetaceae bacterium]